MGELIKLHAPKTLVADIVKDTSTYSERQLYTISTFAVRGMMAPMTLHSGPFGCGKTFSVVVAFGLYCKALQDEGIIGRKYILLGRTQGTVRSNICNELSAHFGDDFAYDQSQKSGVVKDATLFGQNLFIRGLEGKSAEAVFRGLTDIQGILHDEAVLCTKEQFDYMAARLRGNYDQRIPDYYLQNWYVGTTNPDVPTHFLLNYVKRGILTMINWYQRDAKWNGAKEYYNRLRAQYAGNETFYNRYLKGKWESADSMVYPMFNQKVHVIDADEVALDYRLFERNSIAIDYGSGHPTAIGVVSAAYTKEYIISKETKLVNTAPSDIVACVQEYLRFFEKLDITDVPIIVDPSAKGLKDELRKAGIRNVINAINAHAYGIDVVSTHLSTHKLFILGSCENTINEFYSYRYKPNSKEVIKIGDDFVDMVRYGVVTDYTKHLGGKSNGGR